MKISTKTRPYYCNILGVSTNWCGLGRVYINLKVRIKILAKIRPYYCNILGYQPTTFLIMAFQLHHLILLILIILSNHFLTLNYRVQLNVVQLNFLLHQTKFHY